MKISIIYHSESGNTEKAATIIKNSVMEVKGVEGKCMPITALDEEYIKESNVVFFGTPTYSGTYSWQMKKWLDTCKVKFAGKVGCVFATENFIGGGADYGELALISELLVKGMFAYSVGCSEGQPYTHYGAVCIKDGDEAQKERLAIYANRVATNTLEVFGK